MHDTAYTFVIFQIFQIWLLLAMEMEMGGNWGTDVRQNDNGNSVLNWKWVRMEMRIISRDRIRNNKSHFRTSLNECGLKTR